MYVKSLWLQNFRCYNELELFLSDGATLIMGENAQGKTSLLEAISWLSTTRSLRGVPDVALINNEADTAILRAEVMEGTRVELLEVELTRHGRNRVLYNRKPLARARDLSQHLSTTTFSPEDLELVKGSPSTRRLFLDDLLVAAMPKYSAVITQYERVLKHRNALLKTRLYGPDASSSLEVFNSQLIQAGSELVVGRVELIEKLTPYVSKAYTSLAGSDPDFIGTYTTEWGAVSDDVDAVRAVMETAITEKQKQEVERGITLIGPHRDEWKLVLSDLEARTHASQGEQRTLALALRLAGHQLIREATGSDPVLLLDDVFSELDASRSAALVANLPKGQTLITSAGAIPENIQVDQLFTVRNGTVQEGR